MNVEIRPLRIEDAGISWKWRNDPEIWEYTGSKPDRYITYELEKTWLEGVLAREGEKRFAILAEGDYVGNTQLTNIENGVAQFHIFIGDLQYHGKGVGYEATKLVIDFGAQVLKLNKIWLKVNSRNLAAYKIYVKCGFIEMKRSGDWIVMELLLKENL